jgi:N-methylhydantoinase A
VQIGVDIGGTFTDIVALGDDGRLRLTKVPTTPKDLLRGVAAAVRGVLALAGAEAGGVRRFIHGTTVATNAILEQTGAVTGVFMTAGFEDVLELGRQKPSHATSDMTRRRPRSWPRALPVGIRAARRPRPGPGAAGRGPGERRQRDSGSGIQALAVCYLFSFLDPAHERRTREILREVAPGVAISLSSEVDPTFREYERLCVTAFDAYLGPRRRYLAAAGAGAWRDRGAADRRVGASVGGRRGRRPSPSSCPVRGVIGAQFAAERSGVRDFISLDMGGTSNDVSVVHGGRPAVAAEGRIGPYPVRTPMVDVNTIGAGGGSIAWLDAAGGLRVGPRSAGAEPGPAAAAGR